MKIAFYGTKPYDRLWFEPLAKEYGYRIFFIENLLNEDTVVMAKIAWITTSHIKLGMVQNQKPASAVPIQEKTISVLQLNLSARMPPGK